MEFRYAKTLVLTGLAFVAGCDPQADRRVLTKVPFTVTQIPHAVNVKDVLRAPGPFNQVCAGFPDTYQISPGSAPKNAEVRRPDGKVAQLSVTLISADGQAEVFPFTSIEQGQKSRAACFETRPARDTQRRYTRVELMASDSLMVFELRWNAGKRFGSL